MLFASARDPDSLPLLHDTDHDEYAMSDRPGSVKGQGKHDAESAIERRDSVDALNGDDAEFGGHEERVKLERKLLWKVDLRMSCVPSESHCCRQGC
jgi:hypothetical protein